ncbi:Wzz/FepE/Etk N-terminal domain-containing protein [Xanthobacter autotrophicus]|uniref:Wzz/FepE/Etk N-terminal domain-containing protein n=1 Tax=Xanthobacter autotrophicus TaxID=280 RepID=UPI0037278DD7
MQETRARDFRQGWVDGGFRESDPADSLAGRLDLRELIDVVLRQWRLILTVSAIALGLGVIYLLVTPPRYAATTTVLIDTRKSLSVQGQITTGEQIDAGFVDSQVALLKSDEVARAVVRALDLVHGADPKDARPGFLGSMKAWLLSPFKGTAEEAFSEEMAIDRMAKIIAADTSAKRVGLTYLIEVSYTAGSPQEAAKIVNAIADAYVENEVEAKYAANRRAGNWLQDRIRELKDQASATDRAVQTFKSENRIVNTNRGLISDQELSDVSTQLGAARAATAEAKARLDRVDVIQQVDVPDATVADALRSPVISRLRDRYLDLSAREAEIVQRYGTNHEVALNLRAQLLQTRKSIADQLQQIAGTYKSEYEIAKSREDSLQAFLNKLTSQSATTNQAQVKLRDLESAAQVSRNLYDSFLRRYMETAQQANIPVSEARIVSRASDVPKVVWPKTAVVLGGALVFGLGGGLAGAFAREAMGRGFKHPSQVTKAFGIDCLGILPRMDVLGGPAARQGAARISAFKEASFRIALEKPSSRYSEVLRNVKVSIDIFQPDLEAKIVGMLSTLPQEGKTTTAVNLAQILARGGSRTLLIDADLRKSSLAKHLVSVPKYGIHDVLAASVGLNEAIVRDPATGLEILAAFTSKDLYHRSTDDITSDAMARLLANAREEFSYIIIDLPPALPVVDANAISPLVDGFLLVIEWGATAQRAVAEALSSNVLVQGRLIGAILNNADPAVLKRTESYKGAYYNNYFTE